MDPGWVTAAVALATVLAAVVAWFGRWLWRIAARTSRFMDDYYGEPAMPGRPERPGVMARLENLEHLVSGVAHEVHLNSGGSMRDEVQRIGRDVTELQRAFDDRSSRGQ
jgi:hypothetical protein